MATLFLVRHGRAAAGFDGHHDPGLDELGRIQAHSAATILAPL
jgi:broad specificity phosphatase PhoE